VTAAIPKAEGLASWAVTERRTSPTSVGYFAGLAFVWGLNFIFATEGLKFWPPLWLALARAGVGALGSLVVLVVVRTGRTLDARGRRDALLLGIPNTALFFALWFTAASTVLPGIVAVTVYTYPLWVALLSAPVLGHRLSGRHWGSIAAGFAGVVLISQVGLTGGSSVPPIPLAELLASAVAWGVGTVAFQRRFHRDEMLEANTYQLVGGTAMLLLLTAVFEPALPGALGAPVVSSILWLGVLGTTIAYSIWYYLLGRTRAATLSAYLFSVPVVALVASALLFGERLSVLQAAGVLLVLGSIYGIARAPGSTEPPDQRAAL